ncbi:MAG: cytochrome c oxidase assembly protein [Actinomycetota bacterium]
MSWTHPQLHPTVWLLCAVLICGYFLALDYLGPKRVNPGEPVATRAQKRNAFLAVAVIFIAAEWPIHTLAERYLYSVHMIQHLLLTLVAPPLMLAATPAWMARALLPGRLMSIARRVTRPLPALIIFNATLVFTHWPTMVDASVHSEAAHFGLHVLLYVTALIMWMPVLSPLLELPRLSYPGQMVYLFLQSLVPTVPASFLTFGDRPLYHVYTTFQRIGISALTDQRLAGLLMKLVGGFILWGFIIVMFAKWYRIEHGEGVDILGYRDVERTMNRVELTK